MSYRVKWRETAIQRLADVWNRSVNRQSVTDAANKIDKRLADDPANDGESRTRGRRILIEAPLGVYYRVDEVHRIVRVLTLWEFRKRHGTP